MTVDAFRRRSRSISLQHRLWVASLRSQSAEQMFRIAPSGDINDYAASVRGSRRHRDCACARRRPFRSGKGRRAGSRWIISPPWQSASACRVAARVRSVGWAKSPSDFSTAWAGIRGVSRPSSRAMALVFWPTRIEMISALLGAAPYWAWAVSIQSLGRGRQRSLCRLRRMRKAIPGKPFRIVVAVHVPAASVDALAHRPLAEGSREAPEVLGTSRWCVENRACVRRQTRLGPSLDRGREGSPRRLHDPVA